MFKRTYLQAFPLATFKGCVGHPSTTFASHSCTTGLIRWLAGPSKIFISAPDVATSDRSHGTDNPDEFWFELFRSGYSSPRTTKLYDRRTDDISLDVVEKIAI